LKRVSISEHAKEEIKNGKKELFRLTKCEKIYNSMSECDEVCELCGKVLKLGEQCRCDEK